MNFSATNWRQRRAACRDETVPPRKLLVSCLARCRKLRTCHGRMHSCLSRWQRGGRGDNARLSTHRWLVFLSLPVISEPSERLFNAGGQVSSGTILNSNDYNNFEFALAFKDLAFFSHKFALQSLKFVYVLDVNLREISFTRYSKHQALSTTHVVWLGLPVNGYAVALAVLGCVTVVRTRACAAPV